MGIDGDIAIFSPSFFISVRLIHYCDRLKGTEIIRTMERSILASFIGMLGLVLYNFGRTVFMDIPRVIFTVLAFWALVKKISLLYILLIGETLPFWFSFFS
jgi:chromate transport protein ChrA